jgi:hypothetical protein
MIDTKNDRFICEFGVVNSDSFPESEGRSSDGQE